MVTGSQIQLYWTGGGRPCCIGGERYDVLIVLSPAIPSFLLVSFPGRSRGKHSLATLHSLVPIATCFLCVCVLGFMPTCGYTSLYIIIENDLLYIYVLYFASRWPFAKLEPATTKKIHVWELTNAVRAVWERALHSGNKNCEKVHKPSFTCFREIKYP